MGASYSPTNRGKNQFSPIWWQFWGTRFLGNPVSLWCSSSTPFIASLAKPGEYAIEASAFITAKCTFLSSSYNSICPEVPTLIGEMLPQFTGQAHTLSISSIVAYMCIYKGQYYDIYLHNLITIRCWTPEEGDGDTHTHIYIYIYIYIL